MGVDVSARPMRCRPRGAAAVSYLGARLKTSIIIFRARARLSRSAINRGNNSRRISGRDLRDRIKSLYDASRHGSFHSVSSYTFTLTVSIDDTIFTADNSNGIFLRKYFCVIPSPIFSICGASRSLSGFPCERNTRRGGNAKIGNVIKLDGANEACRCLRAI